MRPRPHLLPALLFTVALLAAPALAIAGPLPDLVWTSLADKDVTIELSNGTTLPGHLMSFDAQWVVVAKADGQLVTVARAEVESVELRQVEPPPRATRSPAERTREGRGSSQGRDRRSPRVPSGPYEVPVLVVPGAPPWLPRCQGIEEPRVPLADLEALWTAGEWNDAWKDSRDHGPAGTEAIAGLLKTTVLGTRGPSPLAGEVDVLLAAAWVARCGEGDPFHVGVAVLGGAGELGVKLLDKALRDRLPVFEPDGIAFLMENVPVHLKRVIVLLLQDWELVTVDGGLFIGEDEHRVRIPDAALSQVTAAHVKALQEVLIEHGDEGIWMWVFEILSARFDRQLPNQGLWEALVQAWASGSDVPEAARPTLAELLARHRLPGVDELLERALRAGDEAVQLSILAGVEHNATNGRITSAESEALSELASRGSKKAARLAAKLLR